MIMQLSYPPATVTFYAVVLKYVTFDAIPTDGPYDEIFGFENVPYSLEAASVGYESCYIIYNSGSVPIFMIAILVLQLLFLIITLLVSQGTCVYRFARKKQTDFWWTGFNDGVNDIYMNQCYAIGFNTTVLPFTSTAVSVNNSFLILMILIVALTPFIIAIKLHLDWKPKVDKKKKNEANVVEHREGGEIEEELPVFKKKTDKKKRKKNKKEKRKGLAANAGLAPLAHRHISRP